MSKRLHNAREENLKAISRLTKQREELLLKLMRVQKNLVEAKRTEFRYGKRINMLEIIRTTMDPDEVREEWNGTKKMFKEHKRAPSLPPGGDVIPL